MSRPARPIAERFWEKVNKDGPVPAHRPELGPCWVWTGATKDHGYGVIRPEGQRSGPPLKAHRLAADLAGMDIAERVVRHACDNPPCVNAAHLLVGTQADNVQDMHDRGRGNVGSVNGQAKLTDEKVREIRRRLAAGERKTDLALAFGISKQAMTSLARGRTWRHVA